MRKLALVVLMSVSFANGYSANLPTGFVESLIAQNLDPTDLVLAPDGRIFITIKSGKILIVENGVVLPNSFLTLPVDNFNERGLGHMVLDPHFEMNHFYYVYYTVPGLNQNRISRFTANGNSTIPGSEVVLITLGQLSGTIHNAGAMIFGADGKLYVATGDGGNSANSQNMNNLLGKILRINTDPANLLPTDNPFFVTATGNNRAIYSLGLRNPYSMDVQAGTGKIFVGDVGGGQWEEINEILPGKNYGWPLIEGKRTNQTPPVNYQDPLFAYPHSDGCAIVGAAFYNPTVQQFPASYAGKFFYADYCNQYIRVLDPSTGTVSGFATGVNRAVAIRVANDGTLYYLARAGIGGGSEGDNTSSTNGSLWKVNYTGSGAPFISVNPQSVLVAANEAVTFYTVASGAPTLQYQWQRDGVDIAGANAPSYTIASATLSDDQKKYRCKVTNTQGSATSNEATLTVTSNTRPVPSILTPIATSSYRAGEVISFSGLATDAEDGTIPAERLTWKIDFHHNTHSHPGMESTSGISNGAYTVPRIGETDEDVFYRVYLTATDAAGLSKTIYVDVQPQTSQFTLMTQPQGLIINLDGQPVQTPAVITSVVGVTRVLEAPQIQLRNTVNYLYSNWTDVALTRQFSFNVDATDKVYTAQFNSLPVGNGNGAVGFYYNSSDQTFNNTPDVIRTDETIDFNWFSGKPADEIGADDFVIRWMGEILAPVSATYTFTTRTDDGVRLWIDDALLIDRWIPQPATEWSGSIELAAGTTYPFVMEFFEMGGEAEARLYWSYAGIPRQVVPKAQLFSPLITGITEDKTGVLYPTLTDSEITIQSTSPWVIYNAQGKQMINQVRRVDSEVVSIRLWRPGIYLFRNEKGTMVRFLKY
jgi:glucose/arabinose dehydrogenase